MLTRRQFIKSTIAAGTGMAVFGGMGTEKAWAFYQTTPQTTPLWTTALRGVGPGGIPVAAPDPFLAPVTGVTHYTIKHRSVYRPASSHTWPNHPVGL
jgi:spore coat protein A, manganese oxidase